MNIIGDANITHWTFSTDKLSEISKIPLLSLFFTLLATYRGHVLPERLLSEAGHVSDNGGEIGGSPELELRETLLVGLDHSLDAWQPGSSSNSGRSSSSSRICQQFQNIQSQFP